MTVSRNKGRRGLPAAPHFSGLRRLPVFLCLPVLLLGGCGGDPAPAPDPVPPPPAVTGSASPSAPGSVSTPPPPAGTGGSTATPDVPGGSTPAAPAPAPERGVCGTVTAASGLMLQVLGGGGGGVDCTEAKRIVAAFQQQITGRQAAGSDQPVGETVEGWQCVSGPPSAQGGTTCTKTDRTILAAVIPAE